MHGVVLVLVLLSYSFNAHTYTQTRKGTDDCLKIRARELFCPRYRTCTHTRIVPRCILHPAPFSIIHHMIHNYDRTFFSILSSHHLLHTPPARFRPAPRAVFRASSSSFYVNVFTFLFCSPVSLRPRCVSSYCYCLLSSFPLLLPFLRLALLPFLYAALPCTSYDSAHASAAYNAPLSFFLFFSFHFFTQQLIFFSWSFTTPQTHRSTDTHTHTHKYDESGSLFCIFPSLPPGDHPPPSSFPFPCFFFIYLSLLFI